MAWYKIVMPHSLMLFHGISYLSLVFSSYIHTHLRGPVYTKKIQVTRGVFHGTTLKSVA